MRRVLAVTAIRSEYFQSRSIFQAIMAHPALQLELVIAGAHLTPLHGYTVRAIEEDGFPIVERIESLLYSDRDAARLKGAALQLQLLSHIVDARRPDWLLAIGDREEPMLLALCGAYMNIPVAHYGSGDRVIGNVDDMVRHSISRLAHILLPICEDSRQRLINSGEEPWRVHTVGHAGIDRLRHTPVIERAELATRLEVPEIRDPYLVVIQHSISSEIAESGMQMRETLDAVSELGLQSFISYPNSDAGSGETIRILEEFRGHPNMHLFRTIPDAPFVNLLSGAAVLLGNSSLGLHEAPYLRLAVINIGNRQHGRFHADNVFFVPHNQTAIIQQVKALLKDETLRRQVQHCVNPFGDGFTGQRIANLLATISIDKSLLNKDMTF